MDETAERFDTDETGICNYCRKWDENIKPVFEAAQAGERRDKLEELIKRTKNDDSGEYDVLLGISGGLDSSYAA